MTNKTQRETKKWLKDLDKLIIRRKRNIEFINQLKNNKYFNENETLKEVLDRLSLFPYLIDDIEVLKK